MNEFITTAQAAESGSASEQKAIRDEIAEAQFRVRREMDAGLTPEAMKGAQGAKEALDAAEELINKIF